MEKMVIKTINLEGIEDYQTVSLCCASFSPLRKVHFLINGFDQVQIHQTFNHPMLTVTIPAELSHSHL